MFVMLYSPKGTYDTNFLVNYAYINMADELTRVPGVARVQVFGGQYAMRVWVDPNKLAKLGVTVPQIVSAMQVQNNVNPAGQIGGEPVPGGQEFTYTVLLTGTPVTPEQFGQIVIRANPDGSVLRLKDVARIELGSQTYDVNVRYNGQIAAGMAIYPVAWLQRCRCRGRGQQEAGRAAEAISDAIWTRSSRWIRRRRSPRASTRLSTRSDRARPGDPGRLHLPAGLARHSDPAARRAGLAHRHVRRLPCARLLHQHAVAAWTGARHRPGRR